MKLQIFTTAECEAGTERPGEDTDWTAKWGECTKFDEKEDLYWKWSGASFMKAGIVSAALAAVTLLY